ncbi:MAG: hypothetical protein DI568_11215 [Sphingomonas sp.]|nr:MAG: hypothetical protein DI568_11215 [Sphingomonas sp.]
MATLLFLAFALALAGALFVAFRFGGRDERLVALLLLTAAIVSPFAEVKSFDVPQHGLLLIDAALLLALTAVAVYSDRYWPMFAAGFQLTTVFFHVARGTGAGIMPDAYADSLVFWGYLVIAALVVGTLTEREKATS